MLLKRGRQSGCVTQEGEAGRERLAQEIEKRNRACGERGEACPAPGIGEEESMRRKRLDQEIEKKSRACGGRGLTRKLRIKESMRRESARNWSESMRRESARNWSESMRRERLAQESALNWGKRRERG